MGDSIAPFASIQQVLDASQTSRRFSGAFLPDEDHRSSVVSTKSPPIVTATHAFASLVGSDRRLRKSTTRKLVFDHPISSFESKRERRRSRAFFESDRRRDSVSPRDRSKQETPALIMLRKASKQYNCADCGTAFKSREQVNTAKSSRAVSEALLATSDSGSTRSTRSSIRHPLMDLLPGVHRTDPTNPALIVGDNFGALLRPDIVSENTRASSPAIEEAWRKSNTSRMHSRTNSQEIIWKKDGTPLSWSFSPSKQGTPNRSRRNSDAGDFISTPPDQFPPHTSAVLPTLAEELAACTNTHPSNQTLAIPEDPSGGWPWNMGPSPTQTTFDAREAAHERALAERSPSPPDSQVIHVPRTRPSSPNKKLRQSESESESKNEHAQARLPSSQPGSIEESAAHEQHAQGQEEKEDEKEDKEVDNGSSKKPVAESVSPEQTGAEAAAQAEHHSVPTSSNMQQAQPQDHQQPDPVRPQPELPLPTSAPAIAEQEHLALPPLPPSPPPLHQEQQPPLTSSPSPSTKSAKAYVLNTPLTAFLASPAPLSAAPISTGASAASPTSSTAVSAALGSSSRSLPASRIDRTFDGAFEREPHTRFSQTPSETGAVEMEHILRKDEKLNGSWTLAMTMTAGKRWREKRSVPPSPKIPSVERLAAEARELTLVMTRRYSVPRFVSDPSLEDEDVGSDADSDGGVESLPPNASAAAIPVAARGMRLSRAGGAGIAGAGTVSVGAPFVGGCASPTIVGGSSSGSRALTTNRSSLSPSLHRASPSLMPRKSCLKRSFSENNAAATTRASSSSSRPVGFGLGIVTGSLRLRSGVGSRVWSLVGGGGGGGVAGGCGRGGDGTGSPTSGGAAEGSRVVSDGSSAAPSRTGSTKSRVRFHVTGSEEEDADAFWGRHGSPAVSP